MSTHKAHINTLVSELHDHDQPILIPSDIKDESLLANGIDRGEVPLDVHSVAPLGSLDHSNPVEQRHLAPRLTLVILFNPSRTDDPHTSSDLIAKVRHISQLQNVFAVIVSSYRFSATHS